MRTAQYTSLDRAIAATDVGAIRQRWMYGLRLIRDTEKMSAGGGGLKNGVAAALVTAAQSRGMKLSPTEIRYRIRCAQSYQTEGQFSRILLNYATWTDLVQAGFPEVEPVPGEPPADHRTKAERDRGQRQVLDRLAIAGDAGLPTGMHTSGGRVSGMTVTSLVARGLVTCKFVNHRRAYITGAGWDQLRTGVS